MALLSGVLASGVVLGDELKPFQASYEWSWKGMTVAESTVKLEKSGNTWTYTSKSEPRGLGNIFSERPKMISVLRVTGDEVQPQSYSATDGTSSDNRAVKLQYDWTNHRLTGTNEGYKIDMPLTPDVQDDASVQVALMVESLAGRTPDKFSLLSKDKLRTYHYKREGAETLKTPFGDVPTVIFSSQADYSPRITRFWCAPDRGYVPMKVEQRKDNDVQWTMSIRSITRN
ncbi:MAG: DUF3108 domain-containing protein [Proteobacteria bacterium]|nr:DUF3108 domain-containing protein [Pseudomonadota bacterium]